LRREIIALRRGSEVLQVGYFQLIAKSDTKYLRAIAIGQALLPPTAL